ncbi:MAG: hypothetical protein FWD06_08950 [Oscillospiraceae bacterium]|nr:hypothetical protein [Oscillospiraceae bacterium]
MESIICQACGGALTPAPGEKTLTCAYCGTAHQKPLEQVQQEQELIQERNMTASERMQRDSQARQQALREKLQQEQAAGGDELAKVLSTVATGLGAGGAISRKLKLGCFGAIAVALILLAAVIILRLT